MVKKNIFFISMIIILILIMLYFVLAIHDVKTSAGTITQEINEDTSTLINISINNTDLSDEQNISEVHVLLFENFVFVEDSNGTDATGTFFSNNSSIGVISWVNSTAKNLIDPSQTKYFWFNVTSYTPGVYNITVMTKNSSGNYFSNITITVNDITPPIINIVYPSNNTIYNVNVSNILFISTDNVLLSRCWYSNSSGLWNSSSVPAGENFTNVISEEGWNNFTVYCNDSAGNINSSQVFFIKDTVPPSVTINYPNAFQNISSRVITINITATDTTTLINFTNITIFNYSLSLINSTVDDSEGNFVVTLSVSEDGFYMIRVTSYDNANNVYNTSVNLTLDITPPNLINVVYPLNENIYYNISNINITASDNVLLSRCWYSNSSGLWNSSSVPAGENFTNVITKEGWNNFTVYCNDSAGNMNYSSFFINIDQTPPIINILSPKNGSIFYVNESIPIYFQSSETGTVLYKYVNTTNISHIVGNLTFNISNRPFLNYSTTGLFNITIFANDSVNNLRNSIVYFRVIEKPQETFIINDTVYNITSNVSNLVVPFNSSLQQIILTNASKRVSLDLSRFKEGSMVKIYSNSSNFTLNTSDNVYNRTIIVVLPTNVNITGDSNWNGTINLPKINTSTSNFIAPSSGTPEMIIDVGTDDELNELNFSSPVKMVIEGMGGKRAAWTRGNLTLVDITTICYNETYPNITSGECYTNSTNGLDLIIWTYHFTTFAAYTLPSTETSVSYSSGGGGGGGSVSTTYTIKDSDLILGYTRDLAKGDKVKFNIEGKNQTITISSVSSSEVKFDLSGVGGKTITLGKEDKIDTNNDGKYDLSIKYLTYVNASRRAKMTFKKINEIIQKTENIPSETSSVSSSEENKEPSPSESVSTPETSIKEPYSKIKSFSNIIEILIILFSIITIVFLLYITYRKHKKKKHREFLASLPTY
ncbi:MAG: hypothetical protein QXW97_00925 [Candidatus Pacearchaeota archaeon]